MNYIYSYDWIVTVKVSKDFGSYLQIYVDLSKTISFRPVRHTFTLLYFLLSALHTIFFNNIQFEIMHFYRYKTTDLLKQVVR